MEKTELIEIKKDKTGHGLLIENDGHISLDETAHNRQIKEGIEEEGWHVPHPFIVDAVLQKFGIKNANGRIYPENVLKREVEKYQEKIAEHRAYGECYKPDALILSKDGWKTLEEIKEGDEILTLNVNTKEIEIQKVEKKIEYDYDGEMIHIYNRNFDDVVTPNHGYPIFHENGEFAKFMTAEEIMNNECNKEDYIPRRGEWTTKGDEYFVLKALPKATKRLLRLYPDCKNDKYIPMELWMKFMGIYLAEGDYRKTNYDVNIYQKKARTCDMIEEMLEELGLKFAIKMAKSGQKVFKISDPRLHAYLENMGDEKYVPKYIKNQSRENLHTFYIWFVLGDGRTRSDKRRNCKLANDVFSESKQLVMDLNEIQLKMGYSGDYYCENNVTDKYVGKRLVKGENGLPLHFSLRSLSKGTCLDKKRLHIEKEQYNGKVMCVEVPNHTWYVMSNGKCHWTKNCNHPSESTIDLSRISHNIIETHWVDHTLVGKMEINTSEGFRKQGIVTTCGDQVANLLMNGYKIGISSRGVGSVEQRMGQYIVGDDFELICWDLVSDPSTPGAYLSPSGQQELTQYVEADDKTQGGTKSLIQDKIDSIKKVLNS